jgi:hypothetical protein
LTSPRPRSSSSIKGLAYSRTAAVNMTTSYHSATWQQQGIAHRDVQHTPLHRAPSPRSRGHEVACAHRMPSAGSQWKSPAPTWSAPHTTKHDHTYAPPSRCRAAERTAVAWSGLVFHPDREQGFCGCALCEKSGILMKQAKYTSDQPAAWSWGNERTSTWAGTECRCVRMEWMSDLSR